MMNISPFLAFWTPSAPELVIVLVIALLLFGKRLPDVARSLGKGIVEFKKGVKGIEDDAEQSSSYEPPREKRELHSAGSESSAKRIEENESSSPTQP